MAPIWVEVPSESTQSQWKYPVVGPISWSALKQREQTANCTKILRKICSWDFYKMDNVTLNTCLANRWALHLSSLTSQLRELEYWFGPAKLLGAARRGRQLRCTAAGGQAGGRAEGESYTQRQQRIGSHSSFLPRACTLVQPSAWAVPQRSCFQFHENIGDSDDIQTAQFWRDIFSRFDKYLWQGSHRVRCIMTSNIPVSRLTRRRAACSASAWPEERWIWIVTQMKRKWKRIVRVSQWDGWRESEKGWVRNGLSWNQGW